MNKIEDYMSDITYQKYYRAKEIIAKTKPKYRSEMENKLFKLDLNREDKNFEKRETLFQVEKEKYVAM